MKHIEVSAEGWDHRPYWRYLDTVKHEMPPHLFAFASGQENHNLSSRNSLHDAWLEHLAIEESVGDAQRKVQIAVRLLGPYHDRHIQLTYKNVASYSLDGFDIRTSRSPLHGDLLIHEMRIERSGLFTHELLFESDARFIVTFADFEHRIVLLEQT